MIEVNHQEIQNHPSPQIQNHHITAEIQSHDIQLQLHEDIVPSPNVRNLVDPEPSKVRKSLAKSHHSSSVPYRLCRRVASQSLLEMSRNRVAHHLRHGRVATWSGEFLLSAVESQFFFEISWRSRARPLILLSAVFFWVDSEVGVMHECR